MKLKQFEELRNKFENVSFESNFTKINKILYYFSYLGNILIVLFSYFFLKTVTNGIPNLFPGQDLFFSVFIILFMTGYELFKRFAVEQLFQNIFLKKTGIYMLIGTFICLSLIVGSFYLSIKGSHRLIDDTKTLTTQNDSLLNIKLTELQTKYNKEYSSLEYQMQNTTNLINKLVDISTIQNRRLTRSEQNNLTKWNNQIDNLKTEKVKLDSVYKADKQAITNISYTSTIDETTGDENSFAFFLLTIFLEILIIIGVGFNGFYNVMAYNQTKTIMQSDKYAKLQSDIALLKTYYQNKSKTEGDVCISTDKFQMLAELQGYEINTTELLSFISLLEHLDIIQMRSETNQGTVIPSTKVYAMSYDNAEKTLQSIVGLTTHTPPTPKKITTAQPTVQQPVIDEPKRNPPLL
jgi:hypothetical protein